MTIRLKAFLRKDLLCLKWGIIFIFLYGFSVFSCGVPGNSQNDIDDEEITQIIDQIAFMVDSLVQAEHHDPVAFLDTAASDSPDPGIPGKFYKYSRLRYYFYAHRKDYDTALAYTDSTLQLFGENRPFPESNLFYLHAILAKGEVFRAQHLYGTAIQYFLQGWQRTDPDRTPCMAAEYQGRMATISYRQENYRDAIDFYNRAWQAFASCGDHTEFSRFQRTYQYYQNIASNYYHLEMPDSSLHYNGLALALLEEEGDRFADNTGQMRFIEVARGVALGNRGTSYMALGDLLKAEQLWEESIRINEQPGFANEHAELTRLRLAGYYVEAGRLEEAEEALVLAREWLDEHPAFDETAELRWRRVSWMWLDRRGDTEQAYAAHREYTELKDTVTENKMEAGAIDVAAQIRLAEQQYEITQLRREREVRGAYLVATAGISLMTIVILFLIWRNRRQLKENVGRLTDLNQTVSRQNLRLEKSNRAISKIMKVVAHDLRSPLSGVRELSALMLNDEHLSDDQRKLARLIHDTNSHSMKLVKEILNVDFSQPEPGTLQKKPVEMHGFLQQCVDVLQFRAKEKHQTIRLSMDVPDEGVMATLDRDEMARVVYNVIDNAIKFSPEESTIDLKLEEARPFSSSQKPGEGLFRQAEEKIRISVKDEGIGIPGNLKEKIFDIFAEEAKRPGTNNEKSFGLGLAISKQIVEAHGGTLWFESREGHGTTFTIELPVGQERLDEVKLDES